MIVSIKDKETLKIWNQERSLKLPTQIQQISLRKLIMLNRAVNLNDLKIPPSNHLEKLKGNRAGQHSIRVNDQYRICFIWEGNNASQVEIIDYH